MTESYFDKNAYRNLAPEKGSIHFEGEREDFPQRKKGAYGTLLRGLSKIEPSDDKPWQRPDDVYYISYLAFHLDLQENEVPKFMGTLQGFEEIKDKKGELQGYKLVNEEQAKSSLQKQCGPDEAEPPKIIKTKRAPSEKPREPARQKPGKRRPRAKKIEASDLQKESHPKRSWRIVSLARDHLEFLAELKTSNPSNKFYAGQPRLSPDAREKFPGALRRGLYEKLIEAGYLEQDPRKPGRLKILE